MPKRRYYSFAALAFIALFAAVNLLFLTDFPLVHSDESWLGGLSRAMAEEGSLSVTEPFFTAKPRFPHALKSLFHLLQQGAAALPGYSPFSLRLLSLLFSCACLYVFFLAAKRFLKSGAAGLAATALLGVDIQFIYASHFARSEAMLLLLLCACLYFLAAEVPSRRGVSLCAVLTGLVVFIHPNAFFLACGCGAYLLYMMLRRKLPPRLLLLYCAVTGAVAAAAVGLSYAMDGQFLTHYFANGDAEFDVVAAPGQKLADLFGFFGRLWRRESGTYYLPDIRAQMLLFGLAALLCAVFAAVMKKDEPEKSGRCAGLLCFQAGLIGGIALVGRLNQTSIVFLLPGAVLLFCFAARIMSGRRSLWLLALFVSVSAVGSAAQILPVTQEDSYEQYISRISELVPADAKTIANLNTGFYFENGALLDYRNLPYAAKQGGLRRFIEESGTEYIIYSDELDFIYENRPSYNVIYGSPVFVEELRELCAESCEVVGEFYDPVYGKRINALRDSPEYGNVTVYRIIK